MRDRPLHGGRVEKAGADTPAGPSPVPPETGSRPRPSRAGLEGRPARERAYQELKYRILEGLLKPGTTMLETEVADLLAVSRTPIREALIKLQEERLVAVRPRHGFTVLEQSLDDLAEIYEVFSTLEVRAARLAASAPVAADALARLDALMDRMETATAARDIADWSHLDDLYHAEIVSLCGNRRLQETLRTYWDEQYRVRMLIVSLRPLPDQSNSEHRAIAAAIRAGDPDEAERLHRQHRARADEQAIRLLRSVHRG